MHKRLKRAYITRLIVKIVKNSGKILIFSLFSFIFSLYFEVYPYSLMEERLTPNEQMQVLLEMPFKAFLPC